MRDSAMLALIVVAPGPLQDSLRAFLLTLPQIKTVRLADDTLSAVEMVAQCAPALVLLDASLSDGVSTVLRRIRTEGGQPRYVVLADNRQQQQDAIAAGADVALLKGFPAAEFFEIVEGLLLDEWRFTDSRRLPVS